MAAQKNVLVRAARHPIRAARRLIFGPPEQLRQIQQGLVTMGRHTYHQPKVHFYLGDDDVRVRIGGFSSIALDVEMMPGGNHRTDWVTTFPFRSIFELPGAYEDGVPWAKGDIVVGNDVWIGRGAKVLGGVTIGDGAVVGAYSVVTKDVEPYSIVAGHPAQHRRFRFEPEVRAALLRIAWWNWSDAVLAERVAELSSTDIGAFVERYDPARSSAAGA